MQSNKQIPRRPFNEEVELSIIGLGGMSLLGLDRTEADRVVKEALDKGVNYFDAAPLYGDGDAEEKLGKSLQKQRPRIFLASKTMERDAEGARCDLERSLKRLQTDHLNLWQFHAVTHLEEVERIFGPGGAVEALQRAQREGAIRYVGFSAHSSAAALAMLDRLQFDSIQFPVNFICAAKIPDSKSVLESAREKGIARIALKSMAYSRWGKGEARTYPHCWYKPIDDPEHARLALRFTLSEDITTILPPGDPRLFRMALGMAHELQPLSEQERENLLASARGIRPVINL